MLYYPSTISNNRDTKLALVKRELNFQVAKNREWLLRELWYEIQRFFYLMKRHRH